jgi:hypothetical protein
MAVAVAVTAALARGGAGNVLPFSWHYHDGQPYDEGQPVLLLELMA